MTTLTASAPAPFHESSVCTVGRVRMNVVVAKLSKFIYIGEGATLDKTSKAPGGLSMPSLQDLRKMPIEERRKYIEISAMAMQSAYDNNPELTAFTVLDDEDFVNAAV